MRPSRPVTIIGGGLAGLSLGVTLRAKGVPVRIVEAGHYPRHRVCGEFITGLDDATIARLDIGAALRDAGGARHVSWFHRDAAVARLALPAPARTISRHALDARLAELFVAAGGQLSTRTRCSQPMVEPGVVQASGRPSIGTSPWLGLKVHARDLAIADELELHLGDGAYVGLSAVEDGWTNLCGLFRRRAGLRPRPGQALHDYLAASGLRSLAARLAAAEARPGSLCAVAGFGFDSHVHRGDGVRLGDACAMIPPFTGNGMAMAFISADVARDPLVAWSRDELSWPETSQAIHAALRRTFHRRLTGAAWLHPFLLAASGQRCLGTVARTGLLPLRPLYHLLH